VNIKSVTVGFLIDDQGSSRDVDARFVIPWKARSSRDSIEREPLSFCFTIRDIQPDYRRQALQFSRIPRPLWLPPIDRRAFEHNTRVPPYQWHNGLVRPIPPGEQQYWVPYSAPSIFWCDDRQEFLQVIYDCTTVNDMLLSWSPLSFHHKSDPHNRHLSLLGDQYEKDRLGARASPAWMPRSFSGKISTSGPTTICRNRTISRGAIHHSCPCSFLCTLIRHASHNAKFFSGSGVAVDSSRS
jgi:hypothetical protein